MAEPKVSVTIRAKDLLSKSIRGLRKGLKGLATQGFRVAGQAAKRFGQILTASVAAGLVLATRRAAEFDQRMGQVATLLGAGGDAQKSVKSMSAAILEMTTVLPKSADELGAGLYQVLSAGVERGAEAMKVLGIAARGAVGGQATVLESVDALTTVINAYGGEVKNATAFSDNMFQTIKDGKINMVELASTIGQVATTAALANVSYGDLSAAIGTMTKSGKDAAVTTTSLNRLILAIIDPQDNAAAAAKKYGIELSSSALAQRGFGGLMDDIAKATDGNIDALQAIFPEIRAFAAASIIAGKAAGEFQRQVVNQTNSMGAQNEAFELMNGRIFQQFQLFKNKLNVVLIEFGQKLLPEFIDGMTDASGPLETMRDFIRDNADDIRELGRAFAAMVPIVVRFATFIGKLAIKFGDLARVIEEVLNPTGGFVGGALDVASEVAATGDRARIEAEGARLQGRIERLQNEIVTKRAILKNVDTGTGKGKAEFIVREEELKRLEAQAVGLTEALNVLQDAFRLLDEVATPTTTTTEPTVLVGGGEGDGATAGPGGGVPSLFAPGDPGEGSPFGDMTGGLDMAIAAFEQLAESVDTVTVRTTSMREAFALAFESALLGATGISGVLEAATIGAVKNMSKIMAREQFAKAAADFADGLWPPNPVALAAGAKHLAAGALFTAIGGGGGGRAGVGGAGGSAAPGGFTNDRPFGRSRGTITVQFPGEGFIRAGDPAFQDWLAETIRRAGDRDVIVNPVGA